MSSFTFEDGVKMMMEKINAHKDFTVYQKDLVALFAKIITKKNSCENCQKVSCQQEARHFFLFPCSHPGEVWDG